MRQPERFATRIEGLLTAMRDGGDFGAVALDRFNGGLFAEVAVVPLIADELSTLAEAGRLDWASVERAIFGTLFERSSIRANALSSAPTTRGGPILSASWVQ